MTEQSTCCVCRVETPGMIAVVAHLCTDCQTSYDALRRTWSDALPNDPRGVPQIAVAAWAADRARETYPPTRNVVQHVLDGVPDESRLAPGWDPPGGLSRGRRKPSSSVKRRR